MVSSPPLAPGAPNSPGSKAISARAQPSLLRQLTFAPIIEVNWAPGARLSRVTVSATPPRVITIVAVPDV
jgi:hypothetical protein